MVAEALSAITMPRLSARVIETEQPDLVVLSHVIDFSYGALAWTALASAACQSWRCMGTSASTVSFGFCSQRISSAIRARPTPADEGRAPCRTAAKLWPRGRAERLLQDRVSGNTADVSAIYAFRRRGGHVDRSVLAERFGWDSAKPVVGVYVPNWFDYPNASGRFPFRDFRDWAEATLEVRTRPPPSSTGYSRPTLATNGTAASTARGLPTSSPRSPRRM